jgi:hypothetical protein
VTAAPAGFQDPSARVEEEIPFWRQTNQAD